MIFNDTAPLVVASDFADPREEARIRDRLPRSWRRTSRSDWTPSAEIVIRPKWQRTF